MVHGSAGPSSHSCSQIRFFVFFVFLEALLHEPAGPNPIVAGRLGFFVLFFCCVSRGFTPCTCCVHAPVVMYKVTPIVGWESRQGMDWCFALVYTVQVQHQQITKFSLLIDQASWRISILGVLVGGVTIYIYIYIAHDYPLPPLQIQKNEVERFCHMETLDRVSTRTRFSNRRSRSVNMFCSAAGFKTSRISLVP